MARQTGLATALAVWLGLAFLAPADAASDLCRQLEAQYASGSPGGGAHLDEYDIAIAEQRQQLLLARDRTAEAGCGFAMVGAAVAYCAKLNARIDRMEANLDKLLRHADRSPTKAARADDRLLALLAANGCDTGDSAGKGADARLIEDIFGPGGKAATPRAMERKQSIETVAAPPPSEDTASPPSPSIVLPETKAPPRPAPPPMPDMANEEAVPHQPDPDKRVRAVGPMFLPDPGAAIDLQAPAPR